MLTSKEFVELVEELNAKIDDKVENVMDDPCVFSYQTDGYTDIIEFEKVMVYCSEYDCLVFDDEPGFEKAGDYKTQIMNICKENLKIILNTFNRAIQALEDL